MHGNGFGRCFLFGGVCSHRLPAGPVTRARHPPARQRQHRRHQRLAGDGPQLGPRSPSPAISSRAFCRSILVRKLCFPDDGSWSVSLLLVICGLAAIIGHNYTPWLGFKGGKGIATSAGVLGALMPWVLAVALSLWIIATLLTRTVSIGSILAAASLPRWRLVLSGRMGLFRPGLPGRRACHWRHRSNIQRLLAGTESRFEFSSKKRKRSMNIFILGHGAWGRAIGGVVERLQHQVTFVGHADSAWPAVRPDYILVALPVQHVRETLAASAAARRAGVEPEQGPRNQHRRARQPDHHRSLERAARGRSFRADLRRRNRRRAARHLHHRRAGRTAREGISGHSPPAEFPHLQLGRSHRRGAGRRAEKHLRHRRRRVPRAQARAKFTGRIAHPLPGRDDAHRRPCRREGGDVRRARAASAISC